MTNYPDPTKNRASESEGCPTCKRCQKERLNEDPAFYICEKCKYQLCNVCTYNMATPPVRD